MLKIAMAIGLLVFLAGCVGIPPDPVATQAAPQTLHAATATDASTPTPSESASPIPTEETAAESEVAGTAVAAGRSHTCAVLSNGTVRCWGNNEHGQLGNGGTADSSVPVDVTGVTDAVAITAGWGHVCALTRAGAVACWGNNADGELGEGSKVDSAAPVAVAGLSDGVIAVDAGDFHTCAVTESFAVKCWGKNTYGQLGDGTKNDSAVPVEPPFFGGGVAAVSAGWGHTCVQTTEGRAQCWGNNAYGQLGFGETTDIHLPAGDVINLNGRVMKVTAEGNQTCALTAGGGAQCWGDNRYGQLGDGTTVNRLSPVDVLGLGNGIAGMTAGFTFACAMYEKGDAKCWGMNEKGQLGDGTTVNRRMPVTVRGLSEGIASLAAGDDYACALTFSGSVKCWGASFVGQLGDGSRKDSLTPVDVIGLSGGVAAIASSVYHVCALTTEGGVKCWGLNRWGQLGDGTTGDSSVPRDVTGFSGDAVELTMGYGHTCAWMSAGEILCWGWNKHGQLGDGTQSDRLLPVEVLGVSGGVAALAAGDLHTCALMSDGSIVCWGYNEYGALGDGTTVDRSTPV
jgi:alpha-tubulin suppressor-like RCC1 family protein